MTGVGIGFIIPSWLLFSDDPKEKSKKSYCANIVRAPLLRHHQAGLQGLDFLIETNQAAKLFLAGCGKTRLMTKIWLEFPVRC